MRFCPLTLPTFFTHSVDFEQDEKGGPQVFVELMPLLAGRTVMITIARLDDKRLDRVVAYINGK